MTRPDRNLALIAVGVVLCAGIGATGHPLVPFVLLALAVFALVAVFIGRHHFVGRFLIRRREWNRALREFELQLALLRRPGSIWRNAFHFSLYTRNAQALTLNNIGVVLLNLSRVADAEARLHEAAALDVRYAMPHVNLAITAAMVGDAARATAEGERARQLGFRSRGLQRTLRRLLARSNEKVGATLSAD